MGAVHYALTGAWAALKKFGGPEGTRTPDLLNAIQALSQLSYGPTEVHELSYQTPQGLSRPPTCAMP